MRIARAAAAFLLLLAWVADARGIAGTTGRLLGAVTETPAGAPIAGAVVSIESPSQSEKTTSDARGRFAFISVPPDTYTVTVSKPGYDPAVAVVTVQADQTISISPVLQKTLVTIASVKSRSSASLVRPGTTSDVYSVNAAQQQRLASMGGGGGLMSAYSAIQSVPGIYVPPNQTGFFQILHIRGGDYNQTGYEVDGIPLNNSYNNYPPGSESSLGQQEVQVYAGSTPPNSEGSALAGYINQVIKTGTSPGYGNVEGGVGTPTFFHSMRVEAGGATPDRTFSYYVGIDGHYQTFRYINQFDGVGYSSEFGPPIGSVQRTPQWPGIHPALPTGSTISRATSAASGKTASYLGRWIKGTTLRRWSATTMRSRTFTSPYRISTTGAETTSSCFGTATTCTRSGTVRRTTSGCKTRNAEERLFDLPTRSRIFRHVLVSRALGHAGYRQPARVHHAGICFRARRSISSRR